MPLFVLMNKMNFRRKRFSIYAVFTWCVKVELHEVVTRAVDLNVATPIVADLHRVSVVHDGDLARLIVKGNIFEVLGRGIREIDRRLRLSVCTRGVSGT